VVFPDLSGVVILQFAELEEGGEGWCCTDDAGRAYCGPNELNEEFIGWLPFPALSFEMALPLAKAATEAERRQKHD